MRLLYVIQDYGPETFGGAERHCRLMATRMAARGHNVEVLTSCAKSYLDWANAYEPGTSVSDGVTVHRLPVSVARNNAWFGPLSGRVLTGYKPEPLFLQQHWIEMQGPTMPDLGPWLWENATNYDAVIFFTYLYYPTVRGLPMTSGRVPTVLHPLSHDEPTFHLSVFDPVFSLPTGFAFSVEEDAELVRRRFALSGVQEIVGIGTDLDRRGNADRFRQRFGLGDDPYVVCVGRLDAHKGSEELFDFFTTYKRRNAGPLRLVLLGEQLQTLPSNDDVIITGFVDEFTRDDALEGALVSVHPSYFESFSMTLAEAWAQRVPALVNGHCDVFVGQARRSAGAIVYQGYAEFEAGMDMLLNDEVLAKRLGDCGRAYVERRYEWNSVLDRYERFLQSVPSV